MFIPRERLKAKIRVNEVGKVEGGMNLNSIRKDPKKKKKFHKNQGSREGLKSKKKLNGYPKKSARRK